MAASAAEKPRHSRSSTPKRSPAAWSSRALGFRAAERSLLRTAEFRKIGRMPEFQEQIAKDVESSDSFSLANRKLLKVELEQGAIQARRGAMVAYQGAVTFEHSGAGGLGRMVKKAMTGEGAPLMKVEGT